MHGPGFVNWREGATPTITATRASNFGYWSTMLERQLSLAELMRCQGCQGFAKQNIPDRQLGCITGNAITIPVAEALIKQAATALGFDC